MCDTVIAAATSGHCSGESCSRVPSVFQPNTAASVTDASSWSGSVKVVPQSLISNSRNDAGSNVSAIVRPA